MRALADSAMPACGVLDVTGYYAVMNTCSINAPSMTAYLCVCIYVFNVRHTVGRKERTMKN